MPSESGKEVIRLSNGHSLRIPAGLDDEQVEAIVQEYLASDESKVSMPRSGTPIGDDHPDAPDYVKPKAEPKSATEVFIGALETLGTITSGATTGAIAGAIGAVDGAVGSYIHGYRGSDFADNVLARSEQLASQATYMPQTETGREYLQSVADTLSPLEALPPIAQAIAPSVMMSRIAPDARDWLRADAANAGIGRDLDGMPEIERRVEAARTGGQSLPSGERLQPVQGPTGEQLSPSVGAAAATDVAPDITPDVAAMVLNRFVDPEVAQMYRDASPETRQLMINMLNQAQNVKPGSGVLALPRQILGEAVGNRASMLAKIRERYGQRIQQIVQENGSELVDTTQLGDNFGAILARYNITRNEDGSFNLGRSRISDKEANKALADIYARIEPKIANGEATFAELHVDKQWLQDMVDYDFGSQGGSAQLNNAIKDMAKSVNELLRRDSEGNLTPYARANDAFASTVQPFEDIRRMAKADAFDNLDDPQQVSELARKARGLTNNTAQGVDLYYLLDDLEKLIGEAVERGTLTPEEIAGLQFNPKTMKFDADLNEVAQFSSTVDALFPQLRPTGLQGVMDQTAQTIGDSVVDLGANIATGGKYGMLQGAKNYVMRKPTREQRQQAEREAKEQVISSLFEILER